MTADTPPSEVDYAGLVAALRGHWQIDEDGTNCGVSRQAVCEAADIIAALAAPPNVQSGDSGIDAPEDLTVTGIDPRPSGDSGVREALVELLACKELRTRMEGAMLAAFNGQTSARQEADALNAEYLRRKGPAWDAARAAIEREEREKKA